MNKNPFTSTTNRQTNYIAIKIHEKIVPYANTAKYLGMTLDAKLKWKEHVKKKKEEMNIRYHKIKWLLGKNSKLSLNNKLLLFIQK